MQHLKTYTTWKAYSSDVVNGKASKISDRDKVKLFTKYIIKNTNGSPDRWVVIVDKNTGLLRNKVDYNTTLPRYSKDNWWGYTDQHFMWTIEDGEEIKKVFEISRTFNGDIYEIMTVTAYHKRFHETGKDIFAKEETVVEEKVKTNSMYSTKERKIINSLLAEIF